MGLLLAVSLPMQAEEIRLHKKSGVYHVPLRINDVLTRNFVLDTGAAEVVISEEVLKALKESGTLKQKNYLPRQTFLLANGARVNYPRVILDRISLGSHTVRNVPAVILKRKGALLLGQSFLSRLATWSLDNRRQLLIVADGPAATVTPPGVSPRPALPLPFVLQPQVLAPSVVAQQQLQQGVLLQQDGKLAASIRAYTTSIRTHPTASAYLSRSSAYLGLQDYKGAEGDASQAIRLAPQDAKGYNTRAVVRTRLGNFAGAIADATAALRLNPNDGYAYSHRAVARNHTGDHQGAIRDFQQSANLFLSQGNTKMHRTVLNLMAMVQNKSP